MILTNGFITKVKENIQRHREHIGKFRAQASLLTVTLDLGNILHNSCQWTEDISWPWPKVIYAKVNIKVST